MRSDQPAGDLVRARQGGGISADVAGEGAWAGWACGRVACGRPPLADPAGFLCCPPRLLHRRVKYLYDGDCPMCQSLQTVLARQDNGRGLIRFVNIADPDYDPVSHMGISYDEAMETIHAIRPDGSVITGSDALRELFNAVGLGWATRISELPIIAKIVDIVYNFLSANRLSLGGAMDGIIAAKRMEMSKQGVETCGGEDRGAAGGTGTAHTGPREVEGRPLRLIPACKPLTPRAAAPPFVFLADVDDACNAEW